MSNPESMGEKELLNKAIGGWRGLIDSALPSMLFIVIFVFQKDLNTAFVGNQSFGEKKFSSSAQWFCRIIYLSFLNLEN